MENRWSLSARAVFALRRAQLSLVIFAHVKEVGVHCVALGQHMHLHQVAARQATTNCWYCLPPMEGQPHLQIGAYHQ